jgi:hypothetical protein
MAWETEPNETEQNCTITKEEITDEEQFLFDFPNLEIHPDADDMNNNGLADGEKEHVYSADYLW